MSDSNCILEMEERGCGEADIWCPGIAMMTLISACGLVESFFGVAGAVVDNRMW